MDIIALANELRIATTDTAARDNFARTSDREFSQRSSAENLNIETIISNPFLPTDRKWAIRFNTGGTVTIVLGIRDYWRGWYSAYFANLVTAHLGVPSKRVRLYYCASSGRFSDSRAKSYCATAKPCRPSCKSSRGDH